MFKHSDQRVGIFIDTQNMYHSARHLFKRRVNFQNIFTDAIADRKIIRALAYVISTKTEEEQPFFEALSNMGIELQDKELIEYFSGAKKADWDVGLAIDVVRMLDMLDVVVLVSGDGDFCPLVEYAQSRGRIVELISFKETTNSRLLEIVDASIDLSSDRKRYLMGSARPAKKQAEGKKPGAKKRRPQKKTKK